MVGLVALVLLLSLLVAGKPQYGNPASTSSTTSAVAGSPTRAAAASSSIHVIIVAATGLTFTPNSITANVGDTLLFEFPNAGHSVTQSSFSAPCSYSATGLDSGITTAAGLSWNVTVETSDALWFSCRQTGHCEAGMVFAVNAPTTGNTFEAFQANARSAAPGTFTPTATAVLSGSGVVAAAGVTSGIPSINTATTTTTSSTSTAASTTKADSGAGTITVGRGVNLLAIGAVLLGIVL